MDDSSAAQQATRLGGKSPFISCAIEYITVGTSGKTGLKRKHLAVPVIGGWRVDAKGDLGSSACKEHLQPELENVQVDFVRRCGLHNPLLHKPKVVEELADRRELLAACRA